MNAASGSARAPSAGRAGEQLIAICISTALVMAGQGVVSPVLPLYADTFGVSTAMIGATITVFGLARMITNVPAGAFADRNGRRWLLIGGPIITSVGMAASGAAPSIWLLLVARFIAGLGSALYMTGAQIYLLDIAGPDQRGRFIATNQAALLVGLSFGPGLGGLVAGRFGLAAPFYAVGAAAALTAVYGWFRLPETGASKTRAEIMTTTGQGLAGSDDHQGPEELLVDTAAEPGMGPEANAGVFPTDDVDRWAMVRNPGFLAVGLVSFGVFSIRAGVRQTLIPLQLTDMFGLKVDQLGGLFTALGLIGLALIWPAGWAADRFGAKAVIVPTALAVAVGMLIVASSASLSLFVVGLTISTIGSSVTGPAPAAYVAALAGEQNRGTAMGLYRTSGDLGVVVSPVLSGLLADSASIPIAIAANAIFMALAALVFWRYATARPQAAR